MSIYEFNTLSLKDRLTLTLEKGIFLHNRVEDQNGYNLYSLSDFYVELRLNNGTNEIDKVRSFRSINALEPYLKGIVISKLCN